MAFGRSAFGRIPFGMLPTFSSRGILRFYRHAGSGAPPSLEFGEPAYSDAEPHIYVGNSDGTHSTFVDKNYVDAATAPQPGARVFSNADLLVPPGVISVPFDSERYDTANMFDAAIDATKIYAPTAGVYLAGAQIYWNALTAAGEVGVFIRCVSPDGVVRQMATDARFGSAGNDVRIGLSTVIQMVAGEAAYLWVYNYTDENQTLSHWAGQPGRVQWMQEFWIQRISGI